MFLVARVLSVKPAFVVKRVNQHGDQKAVYGESKTKKGKSLTDTTQALGIANTTVCNIMRKRYC